MLLHFAVILPVLVLTSGSANFSSVVNQRVPPLHSDRCQWQLESSGSPFRFSALPGAGWDNLRNLDMGLIASHSFEKCTLSDDGRYLLPRDVLLYVRKESVIGSYSEIIEHFNNYTYSVSRSINAGGSGTLKSLRLIQGKLSDEYQRARSIALEDNLIIGRTQLIYQTYSVKMQPDFKLSELLTARLKDVVKALAKRRAQLARYRADLIIRDFGTHVVTSVEAGGILEKVDFIKADFGTNSSSRRNKFSAAMSATFHTLLGVNISGGVSVSKEVMQEYTKGVCSTILKSFGGSNLGPEPKLADWLKTLNMNLVPIDRNGEPLCDVISERNLPGVGALQLLDLRKEILSAIERYYKANTIVGCMDPGSSSFDPLANFPGECARGAKNYSFAGVYQTCDDNNPDAKFHLCAENSGSGAVKNPITGKFDCPQEYDSISLFKITGKKAKRCKKKTKRCWLVFHCNDGKECEESTSTLEAFWCAGGQGEPLPAHSGMVYGGAYAADGRFVNDITKTTACSKFFKPYQLGRDIFLCLSLDLELASEHRIPLGGFYSCSSGNPLAEHNREPVALARDLANDDAKLKRCPSGFSQVTLDTIDGCAVMECVKPRPDPGRFPIRRPPFEDPEYEPLEPSVEADDDQGESSRIALGVVGGVLGAVGVGGTAAYLVNRRGGVGSGGGDEDGSGEGGGSSSGGGGGIVRRLRDQLARRFGGRRAKDSQGQDNPEAGGSNDDPPGDECRSPLLPDDAFDDGDSATRRNYPALEAVNEGSADQNATLQVRMMHAIRPR